VGPGRGNISSTGAAPAAATWGPELPLLESPGVESKVGFSNGAIAATTDGRVHIVWSEQDAERDGSLRHQIYAIEIDAGGDPGTAALIVPYPAAYPGQTGLGAKWPSLALTAAGGLALVWHDYRVDGINNAEIFFKERPPGTEWNPDPAADLRLTTTLHPETQGDNSLLPTIRRAPDGSLRVAWYDYRFDGSNAEIMSKARPADGEWDLTPGDSADERVTENSGNSVDPDLAFAADGTAHLLFSDNSGDLYAIYHTWLAPGATGWSTPERLTPAGVLGRAPTIAAGAAGGAMVAAWEDGRDGATRIYSADLDTTGGTWSSARPVTPEGSSATAPALATGPGGGNPLVFCDRRTGALERVVWLQSRAPGGIWDPSGASDERVSLGSRGEDPEICAAPDGRLIVAWIDRRSDPRGDIWCRIRSAPPSGIGSGPAATGAPSRTSIIRHLGASPNPFNPATTVEFELRSATRATLTLHNLQGHRLITLADRRFPAGTQRIPWHGRDEYGRRLPSGLFWLRLRVATGEEQQRALLLLK
jgi:hypothetical protein